MFKKLLCSVLAVAIIAVLAGCEQNEYKRTTKTNDENRIVDQRTTN